MAQEVVRDVAYRHISIPKLFSEGNTHGWFQHFEICCWANGWSDEVKAHTAGRRSPGCVAQTV